MLATVVWLGGIILLVVLVWPEARRTLSENPGLYQFLSRLRKRFFPLINLSLIVLAVTGLIQMAGDSNYDGVMQITNEWSLVMLIKHIAAAGMAIGSIVLQYGVVPALERASLLVERGKGNPQEWERLRRREVILTWITVILGMLVLAFTAWALAI